VPHTVLDAVLMTAMSSMVDILPKVGFVKCSSAMSGQTTASSEILENWQTRFMHRSTSVDVAIIPSSNVTVIGNRIKLMIASLTLALDIEASYATSTAIASARVWIGMELIGTTLCVSR